MNKDCSAKRKINYGSYKWERWIILESLVNWILRVLDASTEKMTKCKSTQGWCTEQRFCGVEILWLINCSEIHSPHRRHGAVYQLFSAADKSELSIMGLDRKGMAGFDENFFCNRPFNVPPYRSISIGGVDDSLLNFVRHFVRCTICIWRKHAYLRTIRKLNLSDMKVILYFTLLWIYVTNIKSHIVISPISVTQN